MGYLLLWSLPPGALTNPESVRSDTLSLCSRLDTYSDPAAEVTLPGSVEEANLHCLLRSLLPRCGDQTPKCDSSLLQLVGQAAPLFTQKAFRLNEASFNCTSCVQGSHSSPICFMLMLFLCVLVQPALNWQEEF